MITKVEIDDLIAGLEKIETMENYILVAVPVPSETTDSGIIKGDEALQDEVDKLEAFMTVLKVGHGIDYIAPHDKVFTQGQVTAFTDKSGVEEMDIAPEGYAVGLVATPYVKLIIKA